MSWGAILEEENESDASGGGAIERKLNEIRTEYLWTWQKDHDLKHTRNITRVRLNTHGTSVPSGYRNQEQYELRHISRPCRAQNG